MSKNIFNKILIIGLGLVGGSFARALRKHLPDCKIFAVDLDENAIKTAIQQQIINGDFKLGNNSKDFDLIVIATPLSSYQEVFQKLFVSNQTIIIDLGSLKNFIKDILPQNLVNNFVGCHPITGSENSGFANSDSELFNNKKFIICNDNINGKKIADLANKIKAIPCFMESKKHDEIYALLSHLPQFISFLTKEFSPQNIDSDFLKKAFRLDGSAPEIWDDIFKLNQKNLEKFYVEFFENLAETIEDIDQNKLPMAKWAPSCNGITIEILTKNFPSIFFRALTALSYLKIKKISEYQEYAGPGFRDFTSIAGILKYDYKPLTELVQKNRKEIIKIFNAISS